MFLVTEFFYEVQILLPNYIWIIPNCQWKKMSWHTLREILGSPLEKKLHSPSTLALIKKRSIYTLLEPVRAEADATVVPK